MQPLLLGVSFHCTADGENVALQSLYEYHLGSRELSPLSCSDLTAREYRRR